MQDTLEIAETIAAQIGAPAFFMMGTTFKVGDAETRSLFFDFRGNRKINRCKIVLEYNDTCTVSFGRYVNFGVQVFNDLTREMVYADNLKEVIENATGLRLSL